MAKIAIIGFGTVGSGVFEIFENSDFTKKTGEEIEVKRVLDIRDFDNHPKKEVFTKDFNDILEDDEISVVCETMGGLHPAYEFTKALLEKGKCVTTSNKELVATYGPELLDLAKAKGVRYMFEASVGGGIPIITPLMSSLEANKIERIAGILNGTTNFILSEMFEKGSEFNDALKMAQDLGYAERNPAADIEGHDASRKIAILSSMVMGAFVDYNDIDTKGITEIEKADVKYAEKMGASIKLIGFSERNENDELYACVAPMIVKNSIPLSGVKDVFNAVMVRGNFLGDAMFYGRGAGKEATASAVSADIIDMVKAKTVSVPLTWETGKVVMTKDKAFCFFGRCESEELVKNTFPDAEIVDGVVSGEVGYITGEINEAEFIEKASKLGGKWIKVLSE
ncbi:MAG: homoserine dehydrogenase [Clostridia bacterium]|nr:homoserine dehydrogenase [Clostridia bacterium]